MTIPLVSICSITYNHAPFIRQCLDGFLMQQCNFPIEIIINDDCSTDGTTEIIREYAEKHPDKIFPIFHEENLYSQGVRGMFQKFVFPKARGKYIALCEGDDYWTDPLKLQKQVDFLESHPDYSMCFHNAATLYENGLTGNDIFGDIEEREYLAKELMSAWVVPTASIIVRVDVARQCPYHSKFTVGDVLIHATALSLGKVYAFCQIMSVYRRHETSWLSTHIADKSYVVQALQHNEAMLEMFPKSIMKYRKLLMAQQYFIVLSNASHQGANDCWRVFKRIMRNCPCEFFVVFVVHLTQIKWKLLLVRLFKKQNISI